MLESSYSVVSTYTPMGNRREFTMPVELSDTFKVQSNSNRLPI